MEREELYYTTKEQSDALVEAGLKPSTADMHYMDYFDDNDYCASLCYDKEDAEKGGSKYAPCWSGANLFALLPKKVYDEDCFYPLKVEMLDNGVDVLYESLKGFTCETFTDALCSAMLWVLANTETKKGKIYVKDTIYDKE